MRKRISQFIKCRHRMSLFLSVILVVMTGNQGVSQGSLSLTYNVLSGSGVPQDGDEVCVEYTATNLTDDTLSNVSITIDANVITLPNNFLLPNGTVLAGATPATGSGTFVLTGSSCSVLSAADIGNGFIVFPEATACGTTGATYSDDAARGVFTGGTKQTVAATAISCFGVSLTCTNYNISLDAECETLLTPELLQINTKVPYEYLRVRIQEEDGSFRPTAMVDDNDVGKAVKVMVDVPGCSDDVAPCWSFANIEYKLGPAQICTTDTVSCAQQIAMNDPILTFACGNTQFIRGEVIREDLCKTSDLFIAKETITYAVADGFGNVSDTCTQVRYIRKPDLENNLANLTFPQDTVVSCDAALFLEDGSVDPNITGVPLLDGVPLFKNRDIPQACNIFADFEDVQDLDVNCRRTIIRQWKITEWRCDGGSYDVPSGMLLQRIVLRDTTAPALSIVSTLQTLSVNEFGCSALFTVPPATATDNCQPDSTIEIEVRYPGGSSLVSDINNTTISIPLGEGNVVEYIARDRCGNESRDTLLVDVVDVTPPVPVCLRDMVVSITQQSVTIGVEKFDENSYDDCGVEDICVVRMDDRVLLASIDNAAGEARFDVFDAALQARASGCYRDYSAYAYTKTTGGPLFISQNTICTPEVVFCCKDSGLDIPVILKVTDVSGNSNECMVMVGVQDKSAPTITCPTEEIVVSCDFDFDENGDLNTLFGTIVNGSTPNALVIPSEFLVDSSGPLVTGTYVDNCFVGDIIEDRTVDRDSICRTGSIIRKFSIVIGNDTSLVCEQLIRIVGDQNNNPLSFAFFPDTEELIAESPTDVKDLAKENPPVVKNAGCSLIGIGFTDQAFHVENSDYCTKIIRTWQVIDWCRNPTGLIELDSSQTILVIDNEAPEITVNSGVTIPQPVAPDKIELTASATDNVIANPRYLNWSYEVYRGTETTPFQTGEIGYNDFRNSQAILVLQGLALGDYTVKWIVSDQCMNEDSVDQEFTIVASRDEVNLVGQVLFSRGGNMDEVEVFLTETEEAYSGAAMSVTDTEGGYAFNNMPLGGHYFIDPEKNDDPLNGVTTLDLILIQRHILGLSVIEDAKLQIAADVNADRRITALDLVELRRLLLGYTDNFTNKDSWTFIHDEQDIEDAVRYNAPLEEVYEIDALESNMDVTFIGIKTGDVSGDAIGHSTGFASGRSTRSATWNYTATTIDKGLVKVDVSVREAMTLNGFQTNISWDNDMNLLSVESGEINLTEENYNLDKGVQGTLPMSYDILETIDLAESAILFTLIFECEKSHKDVVISLLEDRLGNEMYDDSEVIELQLVKETIAESLVLSLAQNTPNPWSEATVISADIPLRGEAILRVYDLHNRLIHKESRVVDRGTQTFTISSDQVNQSGLYFYEVEVGGLIAREKMIRVN